MCHKAALYSTFFMVNLLLWTSIIFVLLDDFLLKSFMTKGASSLKVKIDDNDSSKSNTVAFGRINAAKPQLNKNILYFNRVPKSGSSTMMVLINSLAKTNGYKVIANKNYSLQRINTTNAQGNHVREIIQLQKTAGRPMVYIRHLHFINFTQFGHHQPTMVNIVRDPLSKYISSFYYTKQKFLEKKIKLMPVFGVNFTNEELHNWGYRTLDECFFQYHDKDCQLEIGKPHTTFGRMSIPYFCGHSEECLILGSQWAGQKAKENIDKYFPVVGVLEHFGASLRLFEKILPKYFKGIEKKYQKHENKYNKGMMKVGLSDKGLSYLKSKLAREYELYEYLVQRLIMQQELFQSK